MTTEAVTTSSPRRPEPPRRAASRGEPGTAFRRRRPATSRPRRFSDTFSRAGAGSAPRGSFCWCCARPSAPFFANSEPVLVKVGGHWSSPLLRHLTSTDVIVFVVFFAPIALRSCGSVRHRGASVLWLVALLVPLTLWPAVRSGWRPAGRVLAQTGLGAAGAAPPRRRHGPRRHPLARPTRPPTSNPPGRARGRLDRDPPRVPGGPAAERRLRPLAEPGGGGQAPVCPAHRSSPTRPATTSATARRRGSNRRRGTTGWGPTTTAPTCSAG